MHSLCRTGSRRDILNSMKFLIQLSILLLGICSTHVVHAYSKGEIQQRRKIIQQSLIHLNQVLSQADQSKQLPGFLEYVHFPRSLFDRLRDENGRRAINGFVESEFEYHVPDSRTFGCKRSVELNVPLQTLAYTRPHHPIHLCDRFFSISNPIERAKVLLHEQIHVLGVIDECFTEATAYLIFKAAAKDPSVAYLQRCAKFREYLKDMKKKESRS